MRAIRTLLRQGSTLLHSEPVLFVDHHQTEAIELNALLQQGVGPDDQTCAPGRDRLESLASLRRTRGTGEQDQ